MKHIIDGILAREGGYVDHPADRGGPTKFGITQSTLAEWRRRPVTRDDVRNLSEDEARAIYTARYLSPFSDLNLPPYLLELVVDWAVHSGVSRAIRALQRAVSVPPDGVIGPQTREAVKRADQRKLYYSTVRARLEHIGRLITDDPRQAAFAAGWAKRIAEFIKEV